MRIGRQFALALGGLSLLMLRFPCGGRADAPPPPPNNAAPAKECAKAVERWEVEAEKRSRRSHTKSFYPISIGEILKLDAPPSSDDAPAHDPLQRLQVRVIGYVQPLDPSWPPSARALTFRIGGKPKVKPDQTLVIHLLTHGDAKAGTTWIQKLRQMAQKEQKVKITGWLYWNPAAPKPASPESAPKPLGWELLLDRPDQTLQALSG